MRTIWLSLAPILLLAAAGFSETIRFEDYVTSVTHKIPALRLNRLSLQSYEQDIRKAQASYDITLDGSTTLFRTSATNSVDSFVNGFSSSVSVGTTLIDTGTTLKAGLSYDQSALKIGTVDYATSYVPELSISLTQPLLKGWMGIAEKYAVSDAKLVYDIQKLKLEDSDRLTVLNYEKKFYQWIYYQKNSELLRKNISNAQISERQYYAQWKAGLVDEDTYQSIRASLLQYRESYDTAELNRTNLVQELASVFDVSLYEPSRESWDQALAAAAAAEPQPVVFEESWNQSVWKLTGERLKTALNYYADQTMPELNLSGGLAAVSSDNTSLGASLQSMNKIEYQLGLSFQYSFGDNRNQALLSQAKISLSQYDLQLQETRDDYTSSMHAYLNQMASIKEQIAHKTEKIQALKSRYAAALKKYQQGRYNYSDLLDIENSILSEEISLTSLQYSLIALRLEYAYYTFKA